MTPLDHIAAPPTWLGEAACAQVIDADAIFFPPRNASTAPARGICARCPARAACLAYAVDRAIPYGVYGGLGGVKGQGAKGPGRQARQSVRMGGEHQPLPSEVRAAQEFVRDHLAPHVTAQVEHTDLADRSEGDDRARDLPAEPGRNMDPSRADSTAPPGAMGDPAASVDQGPPPLTAQVEQRNAETERLRDEVGE